MKLITAVEIEREMPRLSHRDKMLMMGSCFSDSIGDKLSLGGFKVDINPFGTLYNPISIARALREILSGKVYSEQDLFQYQGLWHSAMHHGSFSGADKADVLLHINNRLSDAHQNWEQTDVLFLTFGSAFVYYNNEGEVVGNCHKLPEASFRRRRLSVEEIVEDYQSLLDLLLNENRKLKLILTVSPIRHLRDGLHQNQLSKATLLLAIDKLKELYPDKIYYFPAYEIMMDELRDYRYYADDLMHPSQLAVEYIWEKFAQTCFDSDTLALAGECEKIYKALHHRPLHNDDEAHKEFLGQIVLKINRLKEKYPYLEFKTE
jgi:hypothetical protein